MSQEYQCLYITSTSTTGKLRAFVKETTYECDPELPGHIREHPGGHIFEVTLGSPEWESLDLKLQTIIYEHAQEHWSRLRDELCRLRSARALKA
ncbi:hypothetical protein LCGC14_2296350 [marine sediment metagenome]|uniref:Uncharacterized protein n=1 Tax=marine sediment metagenome TaxID=412755 RepID=A0A0F9DCD0_9ZZZZ